MDCTKSTLSATATGPMDNAAGDKLFSIVERITTANYNLCNAVVALESVSERFAPLVADQGVGCIAVPCSGLYDRLMEEAQHIEGLTVRINDAISRL